jgi:mannose-6-phosphate isomerase
VLFEIQQNSDTTYRVFDWNRLGLDGKPRALHIPQSLASMNFNDFEPSLISAAFTESGTAKIRPLVRDTHFTVEAYQSNARAEFPLPPNRMQIIAVLVGKLQLGDDQNKVTLSRGQFALIPACLTATVVQGETSATWLRVEAGEP